MNPTEYATTYYYFRFYFNKYVDSDILRIKLHPKATVSEDCSCYVEQDGSLLEDASCQLLYDSVSFSDYLEISFPSLSECLRRPYTTFQIMAGQIQNSFNGRFEFPLEWIRIEDDEEVLQEAQKLMINIFTPYITQVTLEAFDERTHDTITNLQIKLQISEKFESLDEFHFHFLGFILDPNELSTECTISSSSSLSMDSSCSKDLFNEIIKIADLSEDVSEFSLILENIQNPTNNAIYIVNIYWFSESTLVDSDVLYIPMQFTHFCFECENLEIEASELTYELSFKYINPIESNSSLHLYFPDNSNVSEDISCLFNEGVSECSLIERDDDTPILYIPFPEAISENTLTTITINNLINPSSAGSYEYYFLIFDSAQIKKAMQSITLKYDCPSQYYFDEDELSCKHCYYPCEECVKKASRCLSCSSDSYWIDKYFCVINCPSGYFINGTWCSPCPPGCSDCSVSNVNGSLVCNTCQPSYFQNWTNEGRCAMCSDGHCIECNWEDPSECIECLPHYFLNESKCEECNSNCFQCENSSTICTSCPYKYFLYNNICYSSCPDETFESDSICIDCENPTFSVDPSMTQDFYRISIRFKYPVEVVSDEIKGNANSVELCDYIFDAVSSQRFGTQNDYYCIIIKNLLFVTLGPTLSIAAGDEFTFRNNVLRTKDCLNNIASGLHFSFDSSVFTGSTPTATIKLPSKANRMDLIPLVLIDIDNNGNKDLLEVIWKVSSLPSESEGFRNSIDAALSSVCKNCSTIKIPEGTLPVGEISFTATITNWLEVSRTIESGFMEVVNFPIPLADLEVESIYSISPSDSFLLKARFSLNNTADPDNSYTFLNEYYYTWTKQNGPSYKDQNFELEQNSSIQFFPPNTLQSTLSNNAYIFNVLIEKKDDLTISMEMSYSVSVSRDSSICKIYGIGPKYENEVIRLSADKSYLESSTSEDSAGMMKYTWSCSSPNTDTCKFRDYTEVGTFGGMEIKFDPYSFPLNSEYEFRLSCKYSESSSSSDSGVLSINEGIANVISIYNAYSLSVMPQKTLPLSFNLEDSYLNSYYENPTTPFEIKWRSSNLPEKYFTNGDYFPYLILSSKALTEGSTYNIEVSIRNGEDVGNAEFEISVMSPVIPGYVEVSQSSSSESGFSSEILIEAKSFTYYQASCKLEYFYYWAYNSSDVEWNYIYQSYSNSIITTNKPCVYDCEDNAAEAISDPIENGELCQYSNFFSLFDYIDITRRKTLIEGIDAGFVYLENNCSISISEAKHLILQKLKKLESIWVYEFRLETVINRVEASYLFKLLSSSEGFSYDMVLLVFPILRNIIERDYELFIDKGTIEAKYIDFLELSDFYDGLEVTHIQQLFQVLDTLIQILMDQQKLFQDNINEQIMDLIIKLAKCATKNSYPYDGSGGITFTQKYFNITARRILKSELFESLIALNNCYLRFGSNGLMDPPIDEVEMPNIIVVGEFYKDLFNYSFSNIVSMSLVRIGLFRESDKESEVIDSIPSDEGVVITIMHDINIIKTEQVDSVEVVVRMGEETEFKYDHISEVESTDAQTSFKLLEWEGVTDFGVLIDTYYFSVVEGYNIQDYSLASKSKYIFYNPN